MRPCPDKKHFVLPVFLALLPQIEEKMEEYEPLKPIFVTHQEGLRFVAQVRSHQIATDQASHSGGVDSAPTPLELLGAALGSCIALYVHQFCEVRELPYEGMSVEVRQRNEANPSRVGKFFVRLTIPADFPPEYASMLARVVRACPVHTTLAHGAGVTLDIVSRDAAVAGSTRGSSEVRETLTAVAQDC